MRLPHQLVAACLRDVPGLAAPDVREVWSEAPLALHKFAEAERLRGAERLSRLRSGSRLRAYEENYGLELGGAREGAPMRWPSAVAIEPYPASVRARRLAVG